MITFDLVEAKRNLHCLRSNGPNAKRCQKDFATRVESIARKTQQHLPFTLLHKGQSSAGPDFVSSSNAKPSSTTVEKLIYPTKFMSNSYLAWDLKFTLTTGIQVGAFTGDIINRSEAKEYARQFVEKFMSQEGGFWIDDGGLSDAIKKSSEGKKLIRDIISTFKENMILHKGDFTKCSLEGAQITSPSFSWSSSPTLKILVGGTQELHVELTYITYDITKNTWKARIDVEIKDDFGVTESDITDASPSAMMGVGGLMDMWVLQRQRGQKPFTSVFNFSFLCNGDY
ncbi:MAG: hypothetical protein HWE22_18390 [Flavobacteriales bacterium]|nr:hypothetical protein [Flavobacteriales bacterium]